MTRARYVLITTVASVSVALAATLPTSRLFVWNVSASVPVGLYSLAPIGHLEITDLVAASPAAPLAAFLIERGYIARGVPLMKRVMALPGQEVCRTGHAISVDNVPLGTALPADRAGRTLPVWQGCQRVATGDIFLMNPDSRDSLDGRYFGPIAADAVIGKATPLYTDEAGDGRLVWRAATR